jgi:hypothetical protein
LRPLLGGDDRDVAIAQDVEHLIDLVCPQLGGGQTLADVFVRQKSAALAAL